MEVQSMNSRKSIWLWALALILVMTSVSKSGMAHEKDDANRPFPSPQMVKNLNLTNDQVIQIKAVHQRYKDSGGAVRKKVHEAHAALREAVQSSNSDDVALR